MSVNPTLFDLDFLVFSSHKTATQTLVSSLNGNGLNAKHCHVLQNIGMQPGELRPYLSEYTDKNDRKLRIISVFRDPIDRHISSFFQWYGSKPLIQKEVANRAETIIFRRSVSELQGQFVSELDRRTMIGLHESLDSICEELEIASFDLNYDESRGMGYFEHEFCELYLLRFDVLIQDIAAALTQVSGRTISTIAVSNITANKWYRNIFNEFDRCALTGPVPELV